MARGLTGRGATRPACRLISEGRSRLAGKALEQGRLISPPCFRRGNANRWRSSATPVPVLVRSAARAGGRSNCKEGSASKRRSQYPKLPASRSPSRGPLAFRTLNSYPSCPLRPHYPTSHPFSPPPRGKSGCWCCPGYVDCSPMYLFPPPPRPPSFHLPIVVSLDFPLSLGRPALPHYAVTCCAWWYPHLTTPA